MPDSILFLIFQFVVLIFSVMIHEVSHGYTAERLGDPTARLAGRLTLNPLVHLDPFGSIFLPLLLSITGSPVLLGWAKPVPYNPFNLRKDYKYGPLKVALAGPLSNVAVFIVFGLIARFGLGIGILNPLLVELFAFIAYLNIFLAVFNLIPVPPLDGSKLLTIILPERALFALERMGNIGIIFIFILLFYFAGFISAVVSYIFPLVAGYDVFALIAG